MLYKVFIYIIDKIMDKKKKEEIDKSWDEFNGNSEGEWNRNSLSMDKLQSLANKSIHTYDSSGYGGQTYFEGYPMEDGELGMNTFADNDGTYFDDPDPEMMPVPPTDEFWKSVPKGYSEHDDDYDYSQDDEYKELNENKNKKMKLNEKALRNIIRESLIYMINEQDELEDDYYPEELQPEDISPEERQAQIDSVWNDIDMADKGKWHKDSIDTRSKSFFDNVYGNKSIRPSFDKDGSLSMMAQNPSDDYYYARSHTWGSKPFGTNDDLTYCNKLYNHIQESKLNKILRESLTKVLNESKIEDYYRNELENAQTQEEYDEIMMRIKMDIESLGKLAQELSPACDSRSTACMIGDDAFSRRATDIYNGKD